MGEIADDMLDGTMCEGCGEYLGCKEDMEIPMYCSLLCARNRGAGKHQVCTCEGEI